MDRRTELQKRVNAGYTVEQGGKHLKVKNEQGATVGTVATTPDSPRSLANDEALLRRLGALPSQHGTVTLSDETVDRILAASTNGVTVAEFARHAMSVGKARGLRTPKSASDQKAALSIGATVQRLRRERTKARFKPWLAELLLAACPPLPGEQQEEPPAPLAPPQPVPPAAPPAPEDGTNRQRLTALEETVAALDGRLALLEEALIGLTAAVDAVVDHATKPDPVRGALAQLVRALAAEGA